MTKLKLVQPLYGRVVTSYTGLYLVRVRQPSLVICAKVLTRMVTMYMSYIAKNDKPFAPSIAHCTLTTALLYYNNNIIILCGCIT